MEDEEAEEEEDEEDAASSAGTSLEVSWAGKVIEARTEVFFFVTRLLSVSHAVTKEEASVKADAEKALKALPVGEDAWATQLARKSVSLGRVASCAAKPLPLRRCDGRVMDLRRQSWTVISSSACRIICVTRLCMTANPVVALPLIEFMFLQLTD